MLVRSEQAFESDIFDQVWCESPIYIDRTKTRSRPWRFIQA